MHRHDEPLTATGCRAAAELIASNRNSLCREKLVELMLIVLISEQSISIHGHYSSSFLYLMQNIIVCKENGKYDNFIKQIALLLAELASPVSSV